MTTRRRNAGRPRRDAGSTIPLILAFFVVAFLVVAGAVAFATAFVQQRDLQDVCDGAAAAAAATAVDLAGARSDGTPNSDTAPTELSYADGDTVRSAVDAYLGRDPDRRDVTVTASVSVDRHRLTLRCSERRDLAFGALFGRPTVVHTATSSAESPTSG